MICIKLCKLRFRNNFAKKMQSSLSHWLSKTKENNVSDRQYTKSWTSHTAEKTDTMQYVAPKISKPIDISHIIDENPNDSGENYVKAQIEIAKHKPENEDIDDNQIKLSSTQFEVLQSIMLGKSVFYTGAAGTGKSYILKVLVDVMTKLERAEHLVLTASTGIASCNIRGQTIHSWAGVGFGQEPLDVLMKKIRRSQGAMKRWKQVELLIIDEISMLSGDLFDKLSKLGSHIRGDTRPFGGIQVVLCGDFFQLPPVSVGTKIKFCFESECWNELFPTNTESPNSPIDSKADTQRHSQTSLGKVIVLDKVFRQQNDSSFLKILHEIRRGEVNQSTVRLLTQKMLQDINRRSGGSNSGSIATNGVSGVVEKPTKLFSRNVDVDETNKKELENLGDCETHTYEAMDEGTSETYLKQLQAMRAPTKLELKVGAQVMLLKNLDISSGLANGTRGVIVKFQDSEGWSNLFPVVPIVSFNGVEKCIVPEKWEITEGEKVLATREQIPLMLAYAITIHKSQGSTIPLLDISFNGIFEYGQAYVALSRATSLDSIYLSSFNSLCIRAHPDVIAFYRSMGYSHESDHQDGSYIVTTVSALCEIYNQQQIEESNSNPSSNISAHKRVSEKDKWIESKRLKNTSSTNQLGRVESSFYEGSASNKGVSMSGTFEKYAYDPFMEGYGKIEPVEQTRKAKPYVNKESLPPPPRSPQYFSTSHPSDAVFKENSGNMHVEKTSQDAKRRVEASHSYQKSDSVVINESKSVVVDLTAGNHNVSFKREVEEVPKPRDALSAEQIARIESNRLRALERLQQTRLKRKAEGNDTPI